MYRAKDGHFALAVLNHKLFTALAQTIGHPDLSSDARYATDENRSLHEPQLRTLIETWAQQHAVADVVAQLDAAGVPAAPIWNIEQALQSPQVQARGFLRSVDDPQLPNLQLPTQPVHFSASAPNRSERAPRLGEHTDSVLQHWLGRSQEALSLLRASGALGQ